MTKLIKIYKNNCFPCSQVSGYLKDNAIDHEEYNIMDNMDLAVKYDIMTVPVTILLDDNGLEIDRSKGYNEKELANLISQL